MFGGRFLWTTLIADFRKIIIGFDGSEPAEKALEFGFAIARIMDSELDVIAVVQPPEPATNAETQATIHDACTYYEKSLQRIADNAKENGIPIETHVVVGFPAEQIIRKAEQDRADLIIVGQRGMWAFHRLVLNSVSERVMSYAPAPSWWRDDCTNYQRESCTPIARVAGRKCRRNRQSARRVAQR